MLTLSQRLRALRQERGLTQTQVGHALGVGKMAVSQLEKGQLALTPNKLAKLAQFYGLGVAALCAFEPAPVAAQQTQVVEHLLARLAAAQRELKQKDQTLAEMQRFFTDLNQLLHGDAAPASFADEQMNALAALVQKFGQADLAGSGRTVKLPRPAVLSKQETKDLGEQLLSILLRGIGLSFLAHLQQTDATK